MCRVVVDMVVGEKKEPGPIIFGVIGLLERMQKKVDLRYSHTLP